MMRPFPPDFSKQNQILINIKVNFDSNIITKMSTTHKFSPKNKVIQVIKKLLSHRIIHKDLCRQSVLFY